MSEKIQAIWLPLEENFNQLFKTLVTVDSAILNQKSSEGKWSVLQNLEHLYLTEYLSLGYVNKKSLYPDTLVDLGDKSAAAINILETYFANPQQTLPAPSMVTPDKDVYDLQELKTKWASLRTDIKQKMIELGDDMMDKDLYKHPVSGKMNLLHMLRFFDLHFKHHVKAVEKVLG